jgi:hypothetical protein
MAMTAASFRTLNGFDWVEPQLPKKPTRSFFSVCTGGSEMAQQEYRPDGNIYMQSRKILRELRTQSLSAIDKAYLADIGTTNGIRSTPATGDPNLYHPYVRHIVR